VVTHTKGHMLFKRTIIIEIFIQGDKRAFFQSVPDFE